MKLLERINILDLKAFPSFYFLITFVVVVEEGHMSHYSCGGQRTIFQNRFFFFFHHFGPED